MKLTIECCLLVGVLSGAVWAEGFAGGTGEPNDPYQIATAADLIELGNDPNNYDKHFILTADIDLDPNLPDGQIFDQAVIAPRQSISGYVGFSGCLDGQGYMISHLKIQGVSCLGLFGVLSAGASVSNLGLDAVDVNGTGGRIGGLVGDNRGGIITSVYSRGVVCGDGLVGGLIGCNHGGIVTSSYSAGIVSARETAGGLVGRNWYGIVTSTYSTGIVSGIVNVGGLVGDNYSGEIASSYSSGAVSGFFEVGGFVGDNSYGIITSSFWDIDTSGQSTSAGGIGLRTSEMQTVETYIDAGWDLFAEIRNGFCNYWMMQEGEYPSLAVFSGYTPPELDGAGTPSDPYILTNAYQLGSLWYRPKSNYRLGCDLNLNGIYWGCAVVPWFDGTFDGNGYVISRLQIRGGGYLGLFGCCSSDAIISNLGLEFVDVNGMGKNIGALVGWNSGGITSSYSIGDVRGESTIGGLVGNNTYGSIISSYSAGTVNSDHWGGGGLVGGNWHGTITASYSTATVCGYSSIGGLVGRSCFGSIALCYSAGVVSGDEKTGGLLGEDLWDTSIATLSYWDIDTSGQTASGIGVGLHTDEMQRMATYVDTGWDVVGETGHGVSDYWMLQDGAYPNLAVFSDHLPVEPNGLGTQDDPYQVTNVSELMSFWYRPKAYYRLECDLDLTGINWNCTVIPWFGGRFDGNDHVIKNLQIYGGSYLGLFGICSSGAMITNLGLEAADVNGIGYSNGGLVGKNYGSIVSSYSTGGVSGEGGVGGLVGRHCGFIASSYSTAMVSGERCVGGLTGLNEGEDRLEAGRVNFKGTIVSSYSTGDVSSVEDVGGLVGYNDTGAVVISSYSRGSVYGSGDYVGGFVGTNNGIIASSHSISLVSGDESVGGFVGKNDYNGTIKSSYSTGLVSGMGNYVGGFVGYNRNSITSSYSTGSVSGDESVGGFVGDNWDSLTSIYSTGSVNGTGNYVGGLVGHNHGSANIMSSYSTGSVSGTENYVGGLLGYNYKGTITSSYSTGSVSGMGNYVGGLLGYNYEGSITSSYSIGLVSGTGSYVGGLLGYNYDMNRITSSFWDKETSGQTVSSGGTGLTTVLMQDVNTYLDAGWDFAGETINGPNDIWVMPEADYPRLWWEDFE